MAKRPSLNWKGKVELAETTLRRMVGKVAEYTEGSLLVSESFMRQFAFVKIAEMINNGDILPQDVVNARLEHKDGGLPVPVS